MAFDIFAQIGKVPVTEREEPTTAVTEYYDLYS